MTRIEFKKATEDDLSYILALRKSTMTEHLIAAGWSMTDEEHMKRVMKHFDCGHVILMENIAIGYIKYVENEDAIDIKQFQVSPEYQGKGYGLMILEKIDSFAQINNKGLSLKVLKANQAKRLYERFGFQIVGEDEFEIFMKKG